MPSPHIVTGSPEHQCYGCSIEELRTSVLESFMYRNPEFGGIPMIVAGLMSDAQEEIAMGMHEQARKSLNRAKWILMTFIKPVKEAV